MGNTCQRSDTTRKTLYPFVLLGLFFVGILLACNFFTVPVKHSQAEIPSATASATETSTPVPTETSTATPVPPTSTVFATATGIVALAPVNATPTYAPFCESDAVAPSQCQYPIAEQSSSFCEYKSPYNLIALNDGATYELLHEHVQCSEAGVIDGQRMVICTGPLTYYFELRVCDTACTALTVEADLSRCPFGYNYNNLQGCCTKETQEIDQGCAVLKLDTRSCVFDCGQFTSSSSCSKYGYYCRWDISGTNGVCQLKK